ncbi:tRNA (5-methylaminomethyl-2-thiouridine)(34)-methyltransferase MnmD [Rhabdobacter roseus]|uniref:tRNA U34 5-methylaminomethyl-2-thiouridine-forming methyltransferase MnmC n=1 Tax=Rhabdobacter roseus TaxID=1655419 RepID=A0A840TSA4_9BACT|nr:tRNA (5-methylaminomethyl-2-thiouridine)(34)-methyltransferase MnmD [Rhabdobacter roseus]MBB5286831.1 tRNA U34 5-methylaminomethyl-2-thiouridine-forming methyltransferase MnmC [Rhabdobacter roseus]
MNNPSSERLVLTADGTHSLYSPVFNQHYHSLHGALQESRHIFIGLGLEPLLQANAPSTPIQIFEMGFGTGLNALLAWQLADRLRQPVTYLGVEAFPISEAEAAQLNFGEQTGQAGLSQLHRAAWGTSQVLSDYFTFQKQHTTLQAFRPEVLYDVIFYDAFAPGAQPELWSEATFAQVAAFTRPGGYLVTYSSKGSVRRALQAAGFAVEKHPGPGTKREVVRAVRL